MNIVMNEKPTEEPLRPTKKQKELLNYIERFIAEHGYSPSYREIMSSLNYTSVATVALHVNSLIKRGHLRKRYKSARSLEVTSKSERDKINTNEIKPGEEKWLVEKVNHYFNQAEEASDFNQTVLDGLYVLVGALKVLGLDGAAQSFVERLSKLKDRVASS